ncbi:MAG: hypothetical protein RR594_07300 [Clostridia bacterium]
MKKKGMSLIVLVITILVMIILAGVVVVSLSKNNPIEKAGEALFKTDIASFKDELNLSIVTNLSNTSNMQKADINASGKDMLKYIPSMGDKYIDKLEIVDSELVFIGEKESEKEWADNIGLPSVTLPGKPVITAGLTPIKWVNNVEKDTNEKDPDWADYQNKKWANAKTADGSMWTWIPRYAYRIIYYDKPVIDNNIPSGGKIVGYSDNRGLVDASGKASTAFSRLNGKVDVVLLGAKNFKYLDGDKFVGDVTKTGKDNPNNYVVHPAFSAERRNGYTKGADGNFGSTEEIPGFWVSKFEMSANCTSKTNIASQRNMTISNIFAEGKKIASARGITADSMAMTATQWGAVAYLSKAFGKEPNVNENGGYITGNGNYIVNVAQSTTGNVTGVYDMAGCAMETMASYANNNKLTDANGKNLKDNKNTKYVDVYAVGIGNTAKANYDANEDKYGDAHYEVSNTGELNEIGGWSGDFTYFPFDTYPILYKGGDSSAGDFSGVFSFHAHTGEANKYSSWRGVYTI